MSSSAFGQIKADTVKDDLLKLERNFTDAVINNDTTVLAGFLADDWVIFDSDGGMIDKEHFLAVIRSGALTHESMASKEIRVRIYNDSAVVTALTASTGKYMGQAFTSNERATDVFVKKDGRWQCVVSQLTRVAKK